MDARTLRCRRFGKYVAAHKVAPAVLQAADDGELIAFLHRHIRRGVTSLYDIDRMEEARVAHLALCNDPQLGNNALYRDTLRWYRDFLGDPNYNKPPLAHKPKTPKPAPSLPPEPILTEGAKIHTEYERRYRNAALRQACIARYGCVCAVCGFDFAKVYGTLGEGYIEVHHTEPISTFDHEHAVRVETVVPLCANCHAMVHHNGLLSVDKLKEIYQQHNA